MASSVMSLNTYEIDLNNFRYDLTFVYNCSTFGGALINYDLTIEVPNCGTNQIYWEKICGYPLE